MDTTVSSFDAPASPRTESEHGVLPLEPIEKPRGIFVRLLYRITRKRYGATPTAFRVIYARAPGIALATLAIAMVMERFSGLPKELRFLLQVSMASQKGCTFCADLVLAEAIKQRIGREKFVHLADFEDAPCFDERTKAALAYGAAVVESLRVPDAVFDRLRRHFDEREIVGIVWIGAVERYFNGMALPLRIGSDHLAAPGPA